MTPGEFKPNKLRRKYVAEWGPTSHPRRFPHAMNLFPKWTPKTRRKKFGPPRPRPEGGSDEAIS